MTIVYLSRLVAFSFEFSSVTKNTRGRVLILWANKTEAAGVGNAVGAYWCVREKTMPCLVWPVRGEIPQKLT